MRRAAAATAALLLLAAQAHAATDCARGAAALRRLAGEGAFPLHWVEAGMDDGKPLHLDLELAERDGALHLRFNKTGEGLWAEGAGSVCKAADGLQVRFEPGQLRAGPAAGWLLRQWLRDGGPLAVARPSPATLEVRAPGWRGRFAPLPAPVHGALPTSP